MSFWWKKNNKTVFFDIKMTKFQNTHSLRASFHPFLMKSWYIGDCTFKCMWYTYNYHELSYFLFHFREVITHFLKAQPPWAIRNISFKHQYTSIPAKTDENSHTSSILKFGHFEVKKDIFLCFWQKFAFFWLFKLQKLIFSVHDNNMQIFSSQAFFL